MGTRGDRRNSVYTYVRIRIHFISSTLREMTISRMSSIEIVAITVAITITFDDKNSRQNVS